MEQAQDTAHFIPQPIGIEAGDIAEARTVRGAAVTVEVEKVHTDNGRLVLVFGRRHKRSREGWHIWGNRKLYNLDRHSVCVIPREMLERKFG